MTPVLNNILFRPFEGDAVSESGIIIPDSCRGLSNKGVVVAVGNKVKKVKKGDIGYRVKDWGEEIEVEGIKHYLMNEDAILAKQ